MTGMSVKWFVEDETGNIAHMERNETLGKNPNTKVCVRMVNFLYHSKQVMNTSEQELWTNVKHLRKQWETENLELYAGSGLNLLFDDEINNFIDALKNKTNIRQFIESTPIYDGEILNSIRKTAHKIFIYLANCPKKDFLSWQKYYKTLFTKLSPLRILQNIVNVNKIGAHSPKKEHFVTMTLMEHLDNILDLHYRTMIMAMSTKATIPEGGMIKRFYDGLGKCKNNSTRPDKQCNDVVKQLKTIGNL